MKTIIHNYLIKVAKNKCQRELAYLLIDTATSLLDRLKRELRNIEKNNAKGVRTRC
jgi:hypothetical protein